MNIEKIIELLDKSHSPYHVVNIIKNILVANGFKEVEEFESFNVELNKKYFSIRNDSSIIAFKTPTNLSNYHFQIEASHTDSPTFKLKQHPVISSNGCTLLNVEPYGGMIMSSWFDKPLSFAGRVVVKNGNFVETKLIDIDKDLLIIPNVAIHMNREINSGYKYNPAVDLLPIMSLNEVNFEDLLKSHLNSNEEIISHNAVLNDRKHLILSGVLDVEKFDENIDRINEFIKR